MKTYKKMSSKELREIYGSLCIKAACYGVDTLAERNKIAKVLKKRGKEV